MVDWLDKLDTKRTEEIFQDGGIKVGDFVKLSNFFSDITFEVVSVNEYPVGGDMPIRFSSLTYVRYSKDGQTRHKESARFGAVTKVIRKADMDLTKERVYASNGRYDHGHHIEWQPVSNQTPWRDPRGLHVEKRAI